MQPLWETWSNNWLPSGSVPQNIPLGCSFALLNVPNIPLKVTLYTDFVVLFLMSRYNCSLVPGLRVLFLIIANFSLHVLIIDTFLNLMACIFYAKLEN